MALKKKARIEDLIMGTFVFLALLYPLFVFVLIKSEQDNRISGELNLMRDTYLFITGLEDCSPEVASMIAEHMEEELLRRLGGITGLVRLCRTSRKNVKGTVSIRESLKKEYSRLELDVSITLREKGIPKGKMEIKVIALRGKDFKIIDVSYAQGR